MFLFLEEMKPRSSVFWHLQVYLWQIGHTHSLPSRQAWRECHQQWAVGEGGHVTHRSCECPAERVCVQLTVQPSCDLVHLGHIPLGGHMVLGTNGDIARGALPQRGSYRASQSPVSLCLLEPHLPNHAWSHEPGQERTPCPRDPTDPLTPPSATRMAAPDCLQPAPSGAPPTIIF
jgi:hypothetical protein